MRVLNKRDVGAEAGVYIGRGSKWGNPFVIGQDGTREEVIAKYRDWAWTKYSETKAEGYGDWLSQLRGKDLVCFCAPLACHGEVLLEMIDDEPWQ
jgi:hypothetical protein